MKSLPVAAKAYISLIVTIGLLSITLGVFQAQSRDLPRFFCYFFVALLCSTFKVSLPKISGTMAVNFLFVLIGIADFRFSETLAIGCMATVVQCLWKTKSPPKLVQVLFSISGMAVAITTSYSFHYSPLAV